MQWIVIKLMDNITGYGIEKLELPVGRWLKCNFGNVSETQYTVDGLTENSQYHFRVFAKNVAGSISLPTRTDDPV